MNWGAGAAQIKFVSETALTLVLIAEPFHIRPIGQEQPQVGLADVGAQVEVLLPVDGEQHEPVNEGDGGMGAGILELDGLVLGDEERLTLFDRETPTLRGGAVGEGDGGGQVIPGNSHGWRQEALAGQLGPSLANCLPGGQAQAKQDEVGDDSQPLQKQRAGRGLMVFLVHVLLCFVFRRDAPSTLYRRKFATQRCSDFLQWVEAGVGGRRTAVAKRRFVLHASHELALHFVGVSRSKQNCA